MTNITKNNAGHLLDSIVNRLEDAYQETGESIGALTDGEAACALEVLKSHGFHPDNSEARADAEAAVQSLLMRQQRRKVLEDARFFDIDLRVHKGRVQVAVLANGVTVQCQNFAEWDEGYAAAEALRDFLSLSYPVEFSYQAFPKVGGATASFSDEALPF